jgi:ribosomal protein S18 acetylase RimI-like enzyme
MNHPSPTESVNHSYAELIHQNAILGCQSWSPWKQLTFHYQPELIWYHSPLRDILFNSVLYSDLTPDIFEKNLSIVSEYCSQHQSSLAWLIPNPALLSEFHRTLFNEHSFQEKRGTTGMYLSLTNPETTLLSAQKISESDSTEDICLVENDAALLEWAATIIESYHFPASLIEPWNSLHRAIGYRDSTSIEGECAKTRWEHYLLRSRGEVVATGSLLCGPEKHHSSFANLAVKPQCRGKGYGSRLVRFCLSQLKQYGYETVTLYASQDAYNLYARLGFTTTFRNTFFVRE